MRKTRNLDNINYGYFDEIKNHYRNPYTGAESEYLEKSPTKTAVIENAQIAGDVSILPDSYNRALVIGTPEKVFLQSYDTLILVIDRATGEIKKLWNGYSVTTLKHINTFLKAYNGRTFSKREWESIGTGATL